jgi:DNA-binding transcriptional regulator LsrR (DeoR family)
MGARTPDQDFAAQKAAYLLCERGLTQQQIAGFLKISQSMVSRLLARAEDAGWLERKYRFIQTGLSDARLSELRRIAEPRGLVELVAGLTSDNGVRVRAPHVVESGSGGTTPRAVERRLKIFGRAAASVLMELLPRSKVLGVTWGSTISHVVDNLPSGPALPAIGHAIRFVPVSGEPLDQASNRDTSSHLVERLHRQLRPGDPPPPSLTGVPALIPRRFRGADERAIRRFVAHASSYREVFGQRSPLINKLDSLLTSVGVAERPMGFIFDELLEAGSTPGRRLTKEALARLVAGDIGGVLIPRRDLNAAGRREVSALSAMWTGMQRAHLERVAKHAARRNHPGVIVVSMGADRAGVIAEALRCGLVNELIIDRDLADALVRVLSPASDR